jgi:ribonuclease P protein component
MVQRIARLKRRSEFLRASSEGRKSVMRGLILQAVPSAQSQPKTMENQTITIGYTASRRVGGAVMRNRAKRRLRAAVARVMPAHAAGGHDYVLIARPETLKRPFDGLVGDLRAALARLGLERDSTRGAATTPDAGAHRPRSAAGQPEAMKE